MQKSTQLQIRLSPGDKRRIEGHARSAGLPVSAWVLSRLLPESQQTFARLCAQLAHADTPAFEYAEINDFLSAVGPGEFSAAVADARTPSSDAQRMNYLAAMVEVAAGQLGVAAPAWTRDVPPLSQPVFATELISLRLHLLTQAPPPFRRRNLFVDSTVGARV